MPLQCRLAGLVQSASSRGREARGVLSAVLLTTPDKTPRTRSGPRPRRPARHRRQHHRPPGPPRPQTRQPPHTRCRSSSEGQYRPAHNQGPKNSISYDSVVLVADRACIRARPTNPDTESRFSFTPSRVCVWRSHPNQPRPYLTLILTPVGRRKNAVVPPTEPQNVSSVFHVPAARATGPLLMRAI